MLFDKLIHRADAVKRVVAKVPAILANGQGYLLPFEGDDIPLIRGFEIAIFVKHIIIRQTGLMGNSFYLLFVKKPGGIEKILPFLYRVPGGPADDDTDGIRLFADPVDSSITLG